MASGQLVPRGNRVTLAFLVAALTVSFVVAGCGDDEGGAPTTTTNESGAVVYDDQCAICHGSDGLGGVGPALAHGAMIDAYPDIVDQIEITTEGAGAMPSFGELLTPGQIAEVTAYTREGL